MIPNVAARVPPIATATRTPPTTGGMTQTATKVRGERLGEKLLDRAMTTTYPSGDIPEDCPRRDLCERRRLPIRLLMDSPILPDRPDNAERGSEPVPARYLPPPYALRVVAGVIAVVTAIIGLIWQLQSHPRPALVATVALPAISHAEYGDPNVAALRPATSLAIGARRVCTDEQRPQPRGAWHCHLSSYLSFDAIGVQATGDDKPCTHRTTNSGSSATWVCQTRIPIPSVALHMPYKIPVFFGDLMRGNGIDQKRVAGVCWIEVRAAPSAPWRCGSVSSWRPLLPSFRAVQAVDPGGPCLSRTVDEATGVWWCPPN